MRVVIAEDHALLREGLVALLDDVDIDVVATTDTGPGLLSIVAEHNPDLAIIDVRLPPPSPTRASGRRSRREPSTPALATLILSQYVEPVYTAELLDSPGAGLGYLLKERVSDIADFVDALHRVAAGGTALDREVVSELVRTRSRRQARSAHTARTRDPGADGRRSHQRRHSQGNGASRSAQSRSTSPTSSPSSISLTRTTTTAAS